MKKLTPTTLKTRNPQTVGAWMYENKGSITVYARHVSTALTEVRITKSQILKWLERVK